jgi:ABC-type glycerol-3-phosphate transport system substrate-binding protein
MKHNWIKYIAFLLLLTVLAACSASENTSSDFDHPSEEVAFNYYNNLKNDNFEDALELLSPGYLDYIGYTERDFINTFKDRQTLDGWKITKVEVRSSDKVADDVDVAPQLAPLLTQEEDYLVILDLEIENQGEVVGVVDHMIIAKDTDGKWKIFGIISY